MKPLRITQFWIFALFCSYLSLTPSPPHALQVFSDKILHTTGYVALYLSFSLAYPRKINRARKVFFLLGYSILIEIIQNFIPHRGFSLLDILANGLGLMIGMISVGLYHNYLTRRLPPN